MPAQKTSCSRLVPALAAALLLAPSGARAIHCTPENTLPDGFIGPPSGAQCTWDQLQTQQRIDREAAAKRAREREAAAKRARDEAAAKDAAAKEAAAKAPAPAAPDPAGAVGCAEPTPACQQAALAAVGPRFAMLDGVSAPAGFLFTTTPDGTLLVSQAAGGGTFPLTLGDDGRWNCSKEPCRGALAGAYRQLDADIEARAANDRMFGPQPGAGGPGDGAFAGGGAIGDGHGNIHSYGNPAVDVPRGLVASLGPTLGLGGAGGGAGGGDGGGSALVAPADDSGTTYNAATGLALDPAHPTKTTLYPAIDRTNTDVIAPTLKGLQQNQVDGVNSRKEGTHFFGN